jgi:hypothetical protein
LSGLIVTIDLLATSGGMPSPWNVYYEGNLAMSIIFDDLADWPTYLFKTGLSGPCIFLVLDGLAHTTC